VPNSYRSAKRATGIVCEADPLATAFTSEALTLSWYPSMASFSGSIRRNYLISRQSVAVPADGCIGSYRFEVAMSLVLLFVNPLEENEAALDIDSE